MIHAFQKFMRLLAMLRLRPFDTTTEGGRSKERLRRAGLTTVSSSAARVINMVSSLVTVPLTFRYLGTERYGLWMVLISIVMAMAGFSDLGIGGGLVNAISEAYGKDDKRLVKEYVTSAFVMMFGIALVFAVGGLVSYPYVPWMRVFNVKSAAVATEGASAFLVLYFCFVLNIPMNIVQRAQVGLQLGYYPQIVAACGSIFTLLAYLAVIWVHGSLAWLAIASAIGGILANMVNGFILFKEHPWLRPARHAYRYGSAFRIAKLGLLYFVLQCAFAVSFTSDNIVIAQVLGVAAVAAYAVQQKLFGLVSLVIGMAIMPLWPAYGEAISRGDVEWVRRAFSGSLWLVLGITVPSCTTLVLAGPWILKVFFGKSLHAPVSLLIVLAVWGVVNAVAFAIAVLLNGAGVLKSQAILAVFAGAGNLALSIFFTRRVGVMGVCLGSITAQLLITFPFYFFILRNLFRKLKKIKEDAGMVEHIQLI